jgi:hypothetical protein
VVPPAALWAWRFPVFLVLFGREGPSEAEPSLSPSSSVLSCLALLRPLDSLETLFSSTSATELRFRRRELDAATDEIRCFFEELSPPSEDDEESRPLSFPFFAVFSDPLSFLFRCPSFSFSASLFLLSSSCRLEQDRVTMP